jgi:hypothetical protein
MFNAKSGTLSGAIVPAIAQAGKQPGQVLHNRHPSMTSALEDIMEHPQTSKRAPASDSIDVTRAARGPVSRTTDEHGPSCFGCEEEKGANWTGAGGMHPEIKEKRPSL